MLYELHSSSNHRQLDYSSNLLFRLETKIKTFGSDENIPNITQLPDVWYSICDRCLHYNVLYRSIHWRKQKYATNTGWVHFYRFNRFVMLVFTLCELHECPRYNHVFGFAWITSTMQIIFESLDFSAAATVDGCCGFLFNQWVWAYNNLVSITPGPESTIRTRRQVTDRDGTAVWFYRSPDHHFIHLHFTQLVVQINARIMNCEMKISIVSLYSFRLVYFLQKKQYKHPHAHKVFMLVHRHTQAKTLQPTLYFKKRHD